MPTMPTANNPLPVPPHWPVVQPPRSRKAVSLGEARGGHVTVCIAAKAAIHKDPALVLCMDMMGSTDYSSAETTWKLHGLCPDFYGLIAGPVSAARELAYCCGPQIEGKTNIVALLPALRDGVGAYKRMFADAHIRSRIGISYDEFMSKGSTFLSEDV